MKSFSHTILVVDDDEDVRTLAATIVEDLGYFVREATNGDEALAILREDHSIGLLFTDIVMPGHLSGFALARRAKEIRPALRVLYTTGYAKAIPSEVGMMHGPLLSKPYRPSELAQQIRQALTG